MNEEFEGPYILWVRSDYRYNPQSFNSIDEALKAEKYTSDWIITKKIKYEVIEKEETPTRQSDQMNIKFEKEIEERKEIMTLEEIEQTLEELVKKFEHIDINFQIRNTAMNYAIQHNTTTGNNNITDIIENAEKIYQFMKKDEK